MLSKTILLAALLFTGSAYITNPVLCFSKQRKDGKGGKASDIIRTFTWPDVKEDREARSNRKQVLRAKLEIDSVTTVEVFERPQSPVFYDSLVVIHKANAPDKNYNIGRMINDGQSLRLLYTALIKADAHSGTLVLGFEGGADGSSQGFAVLRFSPESMQLHTLPKVYGGKLVVFRKNPNHLELWTKADEAGESEVSPVHYQVKDCSWDAQNLNCSSKSRIVGPFSKLEIIDPSIEIR
jgi:hypothetical protein